MFNISSRRVLRSSSSRGQVAVAVRRFADEATGNPNKPKVLASAWFRQDGKAGYIIGAMGIVSILGQIIMAYYQRAYISHSKDAMDDDAMVKLERLNMFASRLEKAKVLPTKLTTARTMVDRPGIEAVLQEAMTCKPPEHYYVIYGAKGAGKSTLLEKISLNKDAVIRIQVQSSDRMNEITASIMEAITGKRESYKIAKLSEAFMQYTANSKDGVYPTIIFDVEDGSEERTKGVSHKGALQDVRSIAHGMFNVCHCLIVVSDANGVFQFGQDPREQFIYVDEMTLEDTKKYLNANWKVFSDADLEKIYSNIGGNPAQLTLLLTTMKTYSLDESIESIINVASAEIKAFTLQPILQALKLKENVNGVEPGYFEKQEYKGIDMTNYKAVGNAMKEYNAIVYRVDKKTRVYEMVSTRHKTALKSYEPVIDKKALVVPE